MLRGLVVLLSQLLTLHAFNPSSPHLRSRSNALSIYAEEQRGGVGGLFDEAKARFWRELQVAAMQEELDPLPSELKDAPPAVSLGDASPLPDNFEDSIRLAAKSVTEALADGSFATLAAAAAGLSRPSSSARRFTP